MAESPHPSPEVDSLDIVELVMAMEEAFEARNERPLSPEQSEQLIREIKRRIAGGESCDPSDFDDDALAALVRKLGPRSPQGQAGAAVRARTIFRVVTYRDRPVQTLEENRLSCQ